jgi:DNA-binding NtrC family response regulator
VETALAKILIVDDEINQRTALERVIARWGHEIAGAKNGVEALARLKTFDADVVITDLNMPELDGKGLLEELQKNQPAPYAIVLTAFGNIETALETVHKLGAFWYLEKPVQLPALEMILERAIDKRRLTTHAGRLERELASRGVLGEMVGDSPAMREIFHMVQQAAPTKATILITGESGSGKELAARAIHQLSPRRGGPFFAINCAAMPETLMESELFGHEKGAFTGAVEKRAGCFELAFGGTLLLDEIGDMPMNTQAKLLRVIEERRVRRLGSPRETELDVRILASTNRDLREAIARGTFREDLYFRLNVFEVHLPPLRERKQDIPRLASEMLVELNRRHDCRITDVSPEVEEIFAGHDWPGNVRELRNVLERAAILAGEGTITTAHLPRGFAGSSETARDSDPGGPDNSQRDMQDSVVLEAGMTVEEAERALISLTLRHTGNNRARAAAMLAISPKTLFNKLKENGAGTA